MEQSLDRFRLTLTQLTDVSKLQRAHAQPAEVVDLTALLEEMRGEWGAALNAAGTQLTVEVSACPQLWFAPQQLRQILQHLLSNALQYRAADRLPQIGVRTYPQPGYTVLEVQDNGLGMAQQHLPKLFGLFQRFHDHVEGTGIGLYMVKRMVENAGGRIEVHSQLGVGSTFTLTLPDSPPQESLPRGTSHRADEDPPSSLLDSDDSDEATGSGGTSDTSSTQDAGACPISRGASNRRRTSSRSTVPGMKRANNVRSSRPGDKAVPAVRAHTKATARWRPGSGLSQGEYVTREEKAGLPQPQDQGGQHHQGGHKHGNDARITRGGVAVRRGGRFHTGENQGKDRKKKCRRPFRALLRRYQGVACGDAGGGGAKKGKASSAGPARETLMKIPRQHDICHAAGGRLP
ncbi:HAMP domain-containing histidine kinase (plasmid) [Hymenobacter qilianensis]|uniref:histidine kinase n=1 Tax=Hymenobacter qilianensis TaxID=1385715 RepID=A0A7H0H150_9BACT|nr:HAMP domain-containing histidine kinase [Hymenobacter qilianensis]